MKHTAPIFSLAKCALLLIFLFLQRTDAWTIQYTHQKSIKTRNKLTKAREKSLSSCNQSLFLSPIGATNGKSENNMGTEQYDSARKVLKAESTEGKNSRGVYQPFVSHAWNALQSHDIVVLSPSSSRSSTTLTSKVLVPSDLSQNEAPMKGPGDLSVKIEVKAAASSSSLRLARYAFLETRKILNDISSDDGTSNMISVPNGIHVLNLVLFPKIHLKSVPIFGADLVTLPGNKHLIVIDFQPFLKQPQSSTKDGLMDTNDGDILQGLLQLPNDALQKRLEDLHERHVLNNEKTMPWGGDIPPKAKRYFSPYALWTRLTGEDALEIINTKVFNAFVDYLELYIDVLKAAETGEEREAGSNIKDKELIEGHVSYLNYRRSNDPARPMLKSLYGEEWTERLINEVLFKELEV